MSKLSKAGGSIRPLANSSGGTTSGTAADAHTVGDRVRIVRIASGAEPFHYSTRGDATTNDPMLPAHTVEWLSVRPGEVVSVIQNSSAGAYSITDAE